MLHAFEQQYGNPTYDDMTFATRFGLMVNEQYCWASERDFARLVKRSKLDLRDNPQKETLIYRHDRGLKKAAVEQILTCDWIRRERSPSVLITGATGTGKSYLLNVIALEAIKQRLSVRFYRYTQLIEAIERSWNNKTTENFRTRFNSYDLVAIDEFAMTEVSNEELGHLMDLLNSRIGYGATVITSQHEFGLWHESLASGLQADSIIDRLKNFSHIFELQGASLR